MNYVAYDRLTGRITRMGSAADLGLVEAGTDELLIEGSADTTQHYIDPVTKKPKKRMSAPMPLADKRHVLANGVENARVTRIPTNATVTVFQGKKLMTTSIVTDGVLDLTFDRPGKYRVCVESFPDKEQEIYIDAD